MKIQDRHINLVGFLEGNSSHPLIWSTLQLESDLSEDQWRFIEYFQLRAREFLLNIEDLQLHGLSSLSVSHQMSRVVVKSNTFPGRHRVKSLYLDFRHFTADREPSKFQRIVKLLSKKIDELHPIQIFLSELKKNFLRDANFGIRVNSKELSLVQLVNVWFNTEFFHAGRKEQVQERLDWLKVLDEESAHELLAWGVLRTEHTVKSLYACVKDLRRDESLSVNCPDTRLIRKRVSE